MLFSRLSALVLVLPLLATVGCAAPSEGSASSDSALEDEGNTATPPDEIGAWNLSGMADATSLDIKEDGTWAWAVEGCDFFAKASGTWTADSDDIVLEADGKVGWISRDFPNVKADYLRVTRTNDEILVKGITNAGVLRQTWATGDAVSTCPETTETTGTETTTIATK